MLCLVTGTYSELGVNPDTVCVVLCNLIYTVTEETLSVCEVSAKQNCAVCNDTFGLDLFRYKVKCTWRQIFDCYAV